MFRLRRSSAALHSGSAQHDITLRTRRRVIIFLNHSDYLIFSSINSDYLIGATCLRFAGTVTFDGPLRATSACFPASNPHIL